MKSSRLLLAGLMAVVASIAFTACSHRDLDPSGVYKGDKVLYEADLAITSSYAILDTFVTWEYTNRALLASEPRVTQSADRIRAQAKQWFASAHALRAAYAVSPTSQNAAALQKILFVIQAAVIEASTYMAAPPPSPAAR